MKQSTIKDQKGSALIITLLIVSLLVGLVVNFIYETYIDSASLSNWSNAQKASLIAKSGQTLSANVLKNHINDFPKTMATFEIPVFIDFGPGSTLFIKAEDENSKFNVNGIIENDGDTDEYNLACLKKLFEYLNINPEVTLAIADWIDPDIEPRLPNSENNSKNSFLWSLEELKLIDGIDDIIFNKISPYITVYKHQYNTPQININTAPLAVLVSLHPYMTEAHAKEVVDSRKGTPFTQVADIPGYSTYNAENVSANIAGGDFASGLTVKRHKFRVNAIATVNEITRVIETVMDTDMKIYFWREA